MHDTYGKHHNEQKQLLLVAHAITHVQVPI